jgi:signal transduction histidine kinase
MSKTNVAVGIEAPGDFPPVHADVSRLLQVLLNLLGNALRYTPSGGQVTVSAGREGPQLVLRVHDTGIGIAVEHLPFLFERFYRVDKSRTAASGGSGIGLTIKPRQDILYAGTEINRLYSKNISSTSNQAAQRQNEASRA